MSNELTEQYCGWCGHHINSHVFGKCIGNRNLCKCTETPQPAAPAGEVLREIRVTDEAIAILHQWVKSGDITISQAIIGHNAAPTSAGEAEFTPCNLCTCHQPHMSGTGCIHCAAPTPAGGVTNSVEDVDVLGSTEPLPPELSKQANKCFACGEPYYNADIEGHTKICKAVNRPTPPTGTPETTIKQIMLDNFNPSDSGWKLAADKAAREIAKAYDARFEAAVKADEELSGSAAEVAQYYENEARRRWYDTIDAFKNRVPEPGELTAANFGSAGAGMVESAYERAFARRIIELRGETSGTDGADVPAHSGP